ncbi:LysR family transcriptional regulator [Nisaea sediminum]|uniref:LysR family transcriptional regulator n=1 Tax=Nisaea sediminum TaxID=2775867 RepID=UPI001867E34A|nr:LysR family transcriptional regulator [Nisaea sediminum]
MEIGLTHRLKLPHLRLIVAIADHGQLGRAADAIALTQPAASRMLSDIERILGVRLCERHPRGLSFTLIGRVIARRARAALIILREMSREIGELQQGTGGVVRVGAVTGPAVGYVTPAIRQLKAIYPETEIHVDVGPSTTLVRDLIAGSLDFVLGRIPPDVSPHQLDIQSGRSETIDLVVRHDHPLSSARRVSLEELASYEWIMQARGTPIRTAVDEAFYSVGILPPDNVINTASLLVTIALLSSSTAIAPVSREVHDLLIGERIGARLSRLALERPIAFAPYNLLMVKDRALSPVADRLRALVISELREESRIPRPARPFVAEA